MTAASWENVTDPIFDHAEKRPDAPAIIEGGRILGYRDLATLVGKTGIYLLDQGISRGDHVGVSLENSTDHLILSFALLRIGAVLVELPLFKRGDRDQEGLVRKFGIGRLFLEADAEAPAGTAGVPVGLGWRSTLPEKAGDCRDPGTGDALYSITLSAGSTGIPKGIVTTHRQRLLRAQDTSTIIAPDGRPGNFLLTGSISYSGFFNAVLGQIFVGGAITVLPEYSRVGDFARALASWDDVVCLVTPNMCRALMGLAPQMGVMFPGIKAMISAGLPLFADEKRGVLERITPNLYEIYGSAASGPITTLLPAEMIVRPDSVGRVTAAMEVEIVDGIGNRLPPRTAGHVRCRGAVLSKGFYGMENARSGAEGFRGGWYYPGEIASFDDEGYLYLKGRAVDMIVRRGIEIFPSEIEAVLAAHPLVEEAVVLGRPAPEVGEEVVAFIRLRGALGHDDLVAYCVGRLPPEKRPGNVFYAEQLPRTGAGKIDRTELKALAIGGAARSERA